MSLNFDQLLQFSYSQEDKEFLQRLLCVDGLGRKTAAKILLYLKKQKMTIDDFWVNSQSVFEKVIEIKKIAEKINKSDLEQKQQVLLKKFIEDNIRVVAFWEKEYPSLLLATDDFPLLLYIKGNFSLLQEKSVAVVGTRKVTSYGATATRKIVTELVDYGYTIVSGCMYGVDAIAHQISLDSGGKTVAVLGYGFDQVTPTHMAELQKNILQHDGCLLTEYLPSVSANKGTFPERNRIVAGMSLGVLVVEAALKSGTHITAGCALEAGREVFAVPGSIFNPFAEGTKFLINQGAKLVSSGSDIVAEFKKVVTIPNSGQADAVIDINIVIDALNLDAPSQKVVRELLYLPQGTDELLKETKLPITELLSVLGMLELENIIENEAGVWHCVL